MRQVGANRLRSERGAALVEMAIILPLLVLLVFGIIEFGRGYNASVSLTHAAREGVRTYAITGDPVAGENAAVAAATSLDPALINVTTTACDPGQPTTLTITYPFTYEIPFMGRRTLTLQGEGVMRCGG